MPQLTCIDNDCYWNESIKAASLTTLHNILIVGCPLSCAIHYASVIAYHPADTLPNALWDCWFLGQCVLSELGPVWFGEDGFSVRSTDEFGIIFPHMFCSRCVISLSRSLKAGIWSTFYLMWKIRISPKYLSSYSLPGRLKWKMNWYELLKKTLV